MPVTRPIKLATDPLAQEFAEIYYAEISHLDEVDATTVQTYLQVHGQPRPTQRYYCVEGEAGLIAIAYLGLYTRGNQAYLSTLAVRSNYQRQGYGKRLLTYVEAEARQDGVRAIRLGSTFRAVDFYRKLGYESTLSGATILEKQLN